MADKRRGRRAKGRVTLQDVAAAVGTSPITVSRALKTPEKVSADLRARIEEAVRRLGYLPNRPASLLASKRSETVSVIVPAFSNIVFADVIRALYDVLAPAGYQVLLGNARYSPVEEEKLVATFLQHGPDGMIVTGLDQTDYARRLLADAGIPVVQIMETGPGAIDMNVGFSHQHAGHDMTRYLIDKGRRRVGFIGARMDPRSQRRMAGYRQAMEAAGLDWQPLSATTPAPSSVGLGAILLRDLLARVPDLDAVFCNNDDLAMGAIFECQRAGIAVPERLAIAGFNDLEPAACVNPALTTVMTPRYEMGRLAADLLLEAMAGGAPAARSVDMGYQVVVRDSA